MSTCTKWVTKGVLTCKNWGTKVDQVCTQWADEGSSECSQWADEGSSQCTSWEECHWYTPWNCIAGFFCRAYYWVAKWVCKAWYWVAKWVCKAFAWVVRAVCVVVAWVFSLVCLAWDTLRCAVLAIVHAIAGLFGGGRRSPRKVEHVFVLMLENRSFDHMLGFSGLTGVGIDGQPTAIDGSDPARDTNVDPTSGATVAVGTPAEFWLKDVDKDPGHEFDNTLVALCGDGAVYDPVPGGYPTIDNSGYIQNYVNGGATMPGRVMHCFTPEQLPVLTTLASEFAVCDQWFSSLPGPTWPNRFFAMAGTSGGLDDSPSTLDVVSAVTVDGYRFENGNVFDLLDDNCLEWRIFEGDEFPVSFALSGMNLNALQGRFKDFDDFGSEVGKSSFKPKFVFIEPQYGNHGFDALGPGDYSCGNSMHPLNDVTRGERLVKTVYEAIRSSPHWDKSMLIILFDEHGGFYDHVKPPAAVPPGDTVTLSYVKKGFKFDQLGVRVPAIVVSPWIKQGVIDHTTYDHTSMLASVERLFGMKSLTDRDAVANDVLHLLDLEAPRSDAPVTLPDPFAFDTVPPLVPENPTALACDEDDEEDAIGESEDALVQRRQELRAAQRRATDVDAPVRPPTSTQVGFAQVALLKVLQTAQYPEREQWIEQYKAISTSVDAALFLTEARLKVRHGVDFKRFDRADNPDRKARRRATRRRRP
jgi:phospholipase C